MAAPKSAPVAGSLFTFGDDPARQLTVFKTGTGNRCVVIVGGVVDGFFSLQSLRMLMPELESAGWATVQVQLASCFAGYGGRTHVGDAEDFSKLVALLQRDHDMSEITLFAWSTGVQVVLEYLKSFEDDAEVVTRVILQGVVNDPSEAMFQPEGVAAREALVAEYMASGKREVIVPEEVYDIPMTAARLSTGGLPSMQEAVWQPATAGRGDELRANLSNIKVPLMLLIGSSTEYRPGLETVNRVRSLVSASASTPEVEVSFFDAAGDERRRMLRGSEAEHTAAISFFLRECDRRRTERETAQKQAAADEMRRSRSILAKSLLKVADK